jgi:hypothetical protein
MARISSVMRDSGVTVLHAPFVFVFSSYYGRLGLGGKTI